MNITVNIDNTRLIARVRHAEKRIAYAVVNAINKTAKKVQGAERARVRQDFTVRDTSPTSFLMRQIGKIKPFASVGKAVPYAEISVEQRGRLILPEFETGGIRKPAKGRRVAVPIIGNAARPSFGQLVPEKFQFAKLRFTKTRPIGEAPEQGRRRRRSKKSSGQAIRFGGQGTYLIPSVGVFRRIDRKHSELIYAFVTNERVPKKLNFEDVAQQTVNTWFHEYLEQEISDVLARNG